jgi:hypothetical protein
MHRSPGSAGRPLRVTGSNPGDATTDTDTRSLWPFDGFALVTASFDLYPPKAKVTRSNRVGCASFSLFYSEICRRILRL